MLTFLATGIIAGAQEPVPTPVPTGILATFRMRYPAFAAVPDATVTLWLDEGTLETASWSDGLQGRGTMLYAAHKLAESGQGKGAIASGITSFKSGTFSASLSDAAAARTGLSATIYGREYLDLVRRQFTGPRLAWTPPTSV
jgi:hypothetical protein